jgi:hypothetical protein
MRPFLCADNHEGDKVRERHGEAGSEILMSIGLLIPCDRCPLSGQTFSQTAPVDGTARIECAGRWVARALPAVDLVVASLYKANAVVLHGDRRFKGRVGHSHYLSGSRRLRCQPQQRPTKPSQLPFKPSTPLHLGTSRWGRYHVNSICLQLHPPLR